MHKALRFAVLFVALTAAALPWRTAGAQDSGAVVALRGFFVAVAAKDYASAWSGFSAKTKNLVAQSIAEDHKMTADEVRKLLDSNDDSVQRGFWESFRNSVKPEVYVQLAMSPATAAGADGAVKVKAPSKELTFLMYKEASGWKVGWMETWFPGKQRPN